MIKKPIFKCCSQDQNSPLWQSKIQCLRAFIMLFQTKIYLKPYLKYSLRYSLWKVQIFIWILLWSRFASLRAEWQCSKHSALSAAVMLGVMLFWCHFVVVFYLSNSVTKIVFRCNLYLEIAISFYIVLFHYPKGPTVW